MRGCTAQVEEASPLCGFQTISTVADICPTGRGRTANDAESQEVRQMPMRGG